MIYIKLLRSFYSSKPNDEDTERANRCLCNIKDKISKQCGVSNFIEFENGCIAFSGTKDNPDLFLSLSVIKSNGKFALHADIDDDVSWYEWDFNSQQEFENDIANYIAPLVNRTIKTVTEKKKHKYIRFARYYLSDNSEWVLINEDIVNSPIVRLFLFKDSIKEETKEYHL